MRKLVGIHSVLEAIKVRPKDITKLWVKRENKDSVDVNALVKMASAHKIVPTLVNSSFLDELSRSHQGVGAEVKSSPELDWNQLVNCENSVIVALDGIEDPQNLGAILRTCWLLGAQGILIPGSRSASLTPTVQKIACGGAEHIPVEEHPNLINPLKSLKEMGFWVYGLSEKSKPNIWSVKLPKKIVWVLGSEESGIRSPIQKSCDEFVSIPQTDAAASLNVSVSAAIAIAESLRQTL